MLNIPEGVVLQSGPDCRENMSGTPGSTAENYFRFPATTNKTAGRDRISLGQS